MKRIIYLTGIILLTFMLMFACKTKTEEKLSAKEKIDLSTQDNYEKFLLDWGIAIPDDAVLKEVKKTNDGNYKIVYKLMPFENMLDSLQLNYEKMFDTALLDKGWEKPKEGWDPHGTLYKKNKEYFKFFIVVSEKHDVYELAFKYGQ